MRQISCSRIVFSLLAFSVLAKAGSATIPLSSPTESSTSIRHISKGPNGDLCIVGSVYAPEAMGPTLGFLTVLKPSTGMISAQLTVKPPNDSAANFFAKCRSDGKFVYVAANVDSATQRSMNHSGAYVYKFDERGKLIAKKYIDAGSNNAYIYDLEVDASGVTVVGLAFNVTETQEKNGVFFARLDSALKSVSVTNLANGGFASDATVKLANDTALLAGNFHPAMLSTQSSVDDFAVSKIGASRKYQFSVRPQRPSQTETASAITAGDEVVSLAVKGVLSTMTTVSSEGRVTRTMPVKSGFCRTPSMAADADTVFAVRHRCGDDYGVGKLVSINRKDGVESVLGAGKGEPNHVTVIDATVYVVRKARDGSLNLEIIVRGK